MTAPLINLTDDNLMDLEAWKYGGDNISSMSRMVRSARGHHMAAGVDLQAERRLWGSNVRVTHAYWLKGY